MDAAGPEGWMETVEGLLAEARRMQDRDYHPESLASIRAAEQMLADADPAMDATLLQAERRRLMAHAICREGDEQRDLAERTLAEAFALVEAGPGHDEAWIVQRARLWQTGSLVSYYRGSPDSLHACVAACNKAIALAWELDLAKPALRIDLATSWMNKGNAFYALGDPDCLHAAVAAYDTAIALQQELDLARPEFRNDLARSWGSKGNALREMGGPNNLSASVAAYDTAIGLQQPLDLARPEFRNNLAKTWANKGNALGYLGDPDSLHASVAAYDKAIALHPELDLARPEFRNNLAKTWTNKGNALHAFGDPESLHAAVTVYDTAIALQQELDLARPEFRNDLANSWGSKGNALQALGDPESLHAAVTAYDTAIALRQELNLARPEFRNELAKTWTNKGVALQALGDPDSLHAAGTAYDTAITLRQELDLARPEFRNDLAISWMNKGNALQALGDPGSLHAAGTAYDKAITLRQELDLARPEFRNELAKTWTNKGAALQALGDLESLHAAVVAFDKAIALQQELALATPVFRVDLANSHARKGDALQRLRGASTADLAEAERVLMTAIALLEPLLAFPRPFYLRATREIAHPCFTLARVQRSLNMPDAATDTLDLALLVLRQMEQLGLRNQRSNREILFREALDCARAAGQSAFLPEIIFEQLDPAQPGSAADSQPMHEAAVEALSTAFRALAGRPEHAETLGSLLTAQRRLAAIRKRQFAGSNALALINAGVEDAERRPDEALRILDRQVEFRPNSPGSFWARAQFLAGKGRRAEAQRDLIEAGRRAVVLSRPEEADRAMAAIAKLLMQLRLADIAEAATGPGGMDRGSLLRRFDQLREWLLRSLPRAFFESTEAAELVAQEVRQKALADRLDAHWPEAEALREQLLRAQDQLTRQQIRQSTLQAVAAGLQACRTLLEMLPQSWREFIDEILAAGAAALEGDGTETDEQIQARFVENVEKAVRCQAERLSDHELAAETQELRDTLEDIWTKALREPERRYLACALRCLRDPVMVRFMPIALGCAVEFALLHRLLTPMRTAIIRQELTVPLRGGDWLTTRFEGYLTEKVPHLMLGLLVGGFRRTLDRLLRTEEEDLFDTLAATIRRQPGHATLLSVDKQRTERRQAALTVLADRRNDVSHARHDEPAVQPGEQLWHDVVEHPEDAFFRYFPLIFMPPGVIAQRVTRPDGIAPTDSVH